MKSYDDEKLVKNIEKAAEDAITNDQECCEEDDVPAQSNDNVQNPQSVVEQITIREDLSMVRVEKGKSSTFPVYEAVDKRDSATTWEGFKSRW